ncbi:MAG: hypothetical protein Q9187_001595 [Circinaria calcarea]
MISKLLLLVFAALASAQLPAPSRIQPLINQLISSGPAASRLNRLTPQILESFIEPINVQIERNSYVYRQGAELRLNGHPWTASGANVYWLGLDENVIPPAGQPFYEPLNASYPTFGRITEIMNTLQTMGAHVIRSQTLGVSVGNPLSVMPALGVYNEQAFATIDWSIFQARQHGLRIVVPLTDNYDYYHGGKFNFLRFRGINIKSNDASKVDPMVLQFYTNATIVKDFKDYIEHLLTHVNPYTGLSYAEDPTIFAYETGNELGGPIFGDEYVPVEWTSEIAAYIKELAPHKLVVDGTYGLNQTHLAIPPIDIFSNHYYPPNTTKLLQDITQVESADKVYLVGEYDWTTQNPQRSSLDSFFGIIEARQNLARPVVAGDLFWSLFGRNVPDCGTFVNHTDGFTMQYGNPANSAEVNAQIRAIRQHFFRMRNRTVDGYLPCVACPGPAAEYTYS